MRNIISRKFIPLIGIAVTMTSFVMAAPYNGSGPGTSIINATGTGDYTSLEAAFNAIESVQLTGGDWTFLIETDLTETTQLLVGQNTNGNSIIIKPAPGTQPTVFLESNLSTIVGPSNHIVIGATTYNVDSSLVKTDNFIIDGSNNGTTSRDLTFVTVPNGNESGIIAVIADSDNFELKNCILTLDSPRTISQSTVRIQSVNNSGFTNLTPDNALIENCIINTDVESGIGIVINQGGGDIFGLGANNTIIRNNEINSARTGIFLIDHRNVDILDNQINIVGSAPTLGNLSGIRSSTNSASTDFFQVTVENNDIQVTQEIGNSGVAEGITFSGSRVASTTDALYRIRNNSVYLEPLNATPLSISRITGIRFSISDVDVEIQNNSVNVSLSDFLTPSNTPVTTALFVDNDEAKNDYTIENNIFRFDGQTGYAVSVSLDQGNAYSNDNNFFISRGTAFGNSFGSDHPLLFDYKQATGLDSNSTDTDPLESILGITGTWTSKSDLRFNGPPFMNFMGVPISGLTTDLDGVTRDTMTPTKGAFEISPYAEIPSIAGDSFLYY